MNKFRFLALGSVFLLGLLMTACGSSATAIKPQPTVVISKSFQNQLSPIPSPPAYSCGAWASNNTPGPGATINIYARIMHNLKPVSGATASAVAHFQNFDQQLGQQTSDSGGYVTFALSLQGHQPVNIPATVDVTVTNLAGGGTLHCTPAFFTPV
jgi:hypothetical protein